MGLFNRKKKNKQKNKQKKREARQKRNRDNLSLEEKHQIWIERWGRDSYDPPWNMHEFPGNIKELIDDATIPPGASIVDIGCGTGFLSAELSAKGHAVVGFDFAEPAIEKAKEKYGEEGKKLSFYTADATKPMPFQGSFGVGIDRGTFHTIPFVSRFDYVKSISPLIEPGGCLIILYALRIAKRLNTGNKEQTGEIFRDYLEDLFAPDFKIEKFEKTGIMKHSDEDEPAFRIIMRKKQQNT